MSQESAYEGEAPVIYEPAVGAAAEAYRGHVMAGLADPVSKAAIGEEILEAPGLVLIDIGAGFSTSFGEDVRTRNPRAKYVPIDLNPQAVSRQWEAGFLEGREGDAATQPVRDHCATVEHARFVLAWMGGLDRGQVIEEMLRTGQEDVKLVLIDYDWTQAGGPEGSPVNDLIKKMRNLLESFGFDPAFGAKAPAFVRGKLENLGFNLNQTEVTAHTTIHTGKLRDSLHVVQATADSLMTILRTQGMTEDEFEVAGLFQQVQAHAVMHGDEELRLPDMVAVTVEGLDPDVHREIVARRKAEQALGREALRNQILEPAGPAWLKTYKLTSEKMIQAARRLHAQAFLDRSYVTREGLDEKGALIASITPSEREVRSLYIGTLGDTGEVTGCVRLIESFGLPTIAKLQKQCQQQPEMYDMLNNQPFMQPNANVCEGSALARRGTDHTVVNRLFLALIAEAAAGGFEYGVVSLEKNVAVWLTKAYGKQAFRRIGDESTVIKLEGKGINGEVTLVPYYFDVRTFVQDCRDFFEQLAARAPNNQQNLKNLYIFNKALEDPAYQP